ncbi:hypothetical protein Mal64_12140 [Pseudobythopirellula maris]|uniref:DUF4190 domain-containing protein n=1 Tax=Pseudobythopirellula maris TaxID=2527991 RepID=A0A5C5ZUZ9_9BACT|nr:hypothetical protein [Pseudobythopirellula maris]TWT90817.1 hypothetical protein Mal64_12140 [Pseudobythopirellula maris]
MPTEAIADAPSVGATSEDDSLAYRSIPATAIMGLLISLLGVVAPISSGGNFNTALMLAPIPLAGLLFSLSALSTIRHAPELYTGGKIAGAGAALSVLFLVTSLGYGGYVYATETPDGYERISFIDMKPTEAEEVNRTPIPPDILELMKNEQKVFIKGYIRPDTIQYHENISDFLLVRDNLQCCFGPMAKVYYFDQIQVKLDPGMTTDYHTGLFRLGGLLKVGPGDPESNTPLTFHMQADYVK